MVHEISYMENTPCIGDENRLDPDMLSRGPSSNGGIVQSMQQQLFYGSSE